VSKNTEMSKTSQKGIKNPLWSQNHVKVSKSRKGLKS